MTLLEENMGVNICDLGLVDDFLDILWNTQVTKEKNKLDYIKIKNSLDQRTQSREWKGNPQSGRKCLQNTYLIRSEYQKYIKNSYNSITKETQTIWFKNGQRTWADISSKKVHKCPKSTCKDAQHH